MSQHMVGPSIPTRFVDKRRLFPNSNDSVKIEEGVIFTANASGSTTTIVGANATPSTNTNTIRRGDKFKIYSSSGTVKEEKVFRATSIAVATSTTVTFTPAASTATVSGDFAMLVGTNNMDDISDIDKALNSLDPSNYTQAKLDSMTVNDKVYAIRLLQDPSGI